MESEQKMVVVVDYGTGNVGSILNMLKKIGANAALSMGPEDVIRADRLILPGVGAFDAGMASLKEKGYYDILHQRVLQQRIPILGICLGMQLMTRCSEEGALPGLSWLNAETIRFRDLPSGMKIPHMGWNYVHSHTQSALFPDSALEPRFYFVHSYHVSCNDSEDVLTTTQYGKEFISSICHENILGVQFHPEKSHRFGFEFLQNFINWHPEVTVRAAI